MVKERTKPSGRGVPIKSKAIGKSSKLIVERTVPFADSEVSTVHLQSPIADVEIQANKCLMPRYSRYFKCGSCVGKMSGYKCAFENWRMFRLSPGTNDIIGQPFFKDCPAVAQDPPKFPRAGDFNRAPTSADAFYLQVSDRGILLRSARYLYLITPRVVRFLYSKPWCGGCSLCSLGRYNMSLRAVLHTSQARNKTQDWYAVSIACLKVTDHNGASY